MEISELIDVLIACVKKFFVSIIEFFFCSWNDTNTSETIPSLHFLILFPK